MKTFAYLALIGTTLAVRLTDDQAQLEGFGTAAAEQAALQQT